jgi:uncharacterized membrane protein YhaH (DUF805 family)
MTFSEAISDGFSKYATFDGRSSRSAYWWWFLFALLVGIGAQIVDAVVGTTPAISVITALALFLPGLAVLVRRFHDADHSGWWVLVLIVPAVGLVIWLIFTLTDSKPPNEWGDGPDELVSTAAAPAPRPVPPAGQMQPPPPPEAPPPNEPTEPPAPS